MKREENEKNGNWIKKGEKYIIQHLWLQVGLIFFISLMLITICYQFYIRREYSEFLFEKNLLMETNVVGTMQKNMEYAMTEYIEMGSQIAVNDQVYDLAKALFVDKENLTSNVLHLKTEFSTLISMSGNVLNLSLVSEDGTAYQYDRMLRGATSMWSISDRKFLSTMYKMVYDTANKKQVPRYIVSAYPSIHPTSDERVYHIFYPLIGRESSFDKMNAMLCVTYQMDILEPLIDGFSENNSSYVTGYITDSFNNIIYHSNVDFIGKSESEYLASGNIMTVSESLDKLGWRLHLALNKTEMDQNVSNILYQGVIVYILLLMVLGFIFFMIIKRINYPLNKIKKAMLITGSGEKRKHVSIHGEHEIWQVAKGYNDMLDKLIQREEDAERNYQLSLVALERQHLAEREALETQINAHFLCNTLGTINYEAMEAGNFKVSVLIKKLSNILRYTFDQRCQTVYMYQEIAWIYQYLYLQKSRFEDVFDYDIQFPDEFNQWPCCKLMLQPFVENAIIHGFEGREVGGLLEISAKSNAGFLELSVSDNGYGIPEEKLMRIQDMLKCENNKQMDDIGIGIQNVVSRMRLFYGFQVQIHVESQVGKGTKFTFLLPFSKAEDKAEGGIVCD
ncbi:MAG: histidine kinase [Lachnospiraceae bacterium]|nr:histidine kinase [Lachnospiraceae bacterium]